MNMTITEKNNAKLTLLVVAGIGNNTIYAGTGNVTIYGAGGNNFINLESGNDYVILQGGNNIVFGGTGDNTIVSGDAGMSDISRASETTANNTIYGGSGNTIIEDKVGTNKVIFNSQVLFSFITSDGINYLSEDGAFRGIRSNGDFIVTDIVTHDQVTLNQHFQSGDFGLGWGAGSASNDFEWKVQA
jgi:Ca2+-binding RTX toxin-like protein